MTEKMSTEEISWMNAPAGPHQEMEKACNREDGIEAGVLQITKANVREPGQVIVFTPEQIEEYCDRLKNVSPEAYSQTGREQVFKMGLAIIKQLQEELVCLNLQK